MVSVTAHLDVTAHSSTNQVFHGQAAEEPQKY